MSQSNETFVSRAGAKLAAALDALTIDPAGWVCADLGANVGGFTDCLLQRGAAKVYAVDTGYGTLAWKLRRDPRVIVMERTNALHASPPELVDLVVIDVGWTPQRLILPAARKWIKQPAGQILTLLKPHYEAADCAHLAEGAKKSPPKHVLPLEESHRQCLLTCEQIAADGWLVDAVVPSPIEGTGGNAEFVLQVRTKARE